MISLGLLLIAAALFLTGYNMYDQARAGQTADLAVSSLEKQIPKEVLTVPGKDWQEEPLAPGEIEYPDYMLNPEMEMPVEEIDGVEYIGMLSIPVLELELPVISQWSYPGLKIAPCRYVGSAYLDNLVIAAHNYQSHFGLLKTLSQGDMITFTDMDGNVFRYEVAALETLAPTDIEGMVSEEYALTLFTCTLGGASRVTVRCDRVEEPGR